MAVDIRIGKWRKRLVIHDDHVRCRAFLQDAERLLKVFGGNLPVVFKEHRHVFAPGDIWQAGVVPLDNEEDLEGFQHIVRIGVRAHADGDALRHHLEYRRAADGISHIGFGIVDHHRAGLFDNVHLGRIHVDAVAEQSLFTEDPVVQQAVHRAAAIVAQAVVDVIHPLRHMNMEAGQAIVRFYHFGKCFIGNGKERMSAKHRLDHVVVFFGGPLREVGIFLNGLIAFLLAVPLGNFIAQAGADAEFLCRVLDHKQGAGYLAK